jgi:hypothetical protein
MEKSISRVFVDEYVYIYTHTYTCTDNKVVCV